MTELCYEHSGHACRIKNLEEDVDGLGIKVDRVIWLLIGIAAEIPVSLGLVII